tara:strand:+ start:2754 stop:3674 length:921 start_codon:yes stop_codon:yes gene_type:complete
LLCFSLPFNAEEYKNKTLEIKIISSDTEKISILKNLSGDLLITTTPSVGSQFFPKSKIMPRDQRPQYLYLFHSLVSPNEMYVKNSFKNYDYIFTPSQIVSQQIQDLIGKTSEVYETGYLLFDNLKPFQSKEKTSNKALIAPTWGEEGVAEITARISEIIKFLDISNLKGVFRPHPMTDLAEYNLNRDIEVDTNKGLNNLHEYDLLITDYSGIALEYYFLTQKPVIFLDVPKKIKRKVNKNEKKLSLIEDSMRHIIGTTITIDSLVGFELPIVLDKKKAKDFIFNVCGSSKVLERSIEIIERDILDS